ncbi:MAG: hypothetical protein CW341_03590 [Bacteroidetes bacterium]|nr:hypothetical protein [Bacteroidota bacterium]
MQKRVSVQLTFAASVGGRTERAAFMSAKELVFFAPFFWSGKRKGNKKEKIYTIAIRLYVIQEFYVTLQVKIKYQ